MKKANNQTAASAYKAGESIAERRKDPDAGNKNPDRKGAVNSEKITDGQPVAPESGSNVLESETGFVEGKVSEIAKTKAGENPGTPNPNNNTQKSSDSSDDEKLKEDREALKAKLLKKAPPEEKMKRQVERKLIKKKNRLESAVSKHRRKRNYYLLSRSIMHLRQVVRQLEDLAKLSYERLKDLWLNVVHKVA